MEEGWESDSFQLGDWEVWQMKGASQEEVKPSTLRGPRVCFVLWDLLWDNPCTYLPDGRSKPFSPFSLALGERAKPLQLQVARSPGGSDACSKGGAAGSLNNGDVPMLLGEWVQRKAQEPS